MDTNIPEMLTIAEVARRTHLSPMFVRQLVWDDKVVHIKAGKKYLVNFQKFVAFLNGDTGDNSKK